MRLSKLVGERTKENPSDISIRSHALCVRAGLIKPVANGIFTLLTPAKKSILKIEKIIRDEMDKIDGQEVMFPVVMPKELWEESGRYYSIGEEMVRFRDRGEKEMVLGMTHEEAAVHLVRNTLSSYKDLPVMVYQIQTKFRDEARPRGGLIRVREFTMKDAYSFHNSQEELESYYQKAFDAYERIFKKLGMQNVVSVKADTGMMGGNISHEFMLIADIGEDTLAICDNCDYKSNMEVAESILERKIKKTTKAEEVFTGEAKEIKEVCDFLKIEPQDTIKAVCFAEIGQKDKIVIVFIRGDLEVNEAKLKKVLKKDIAPVDLKDSELVAGNIGVFNLPSNENLTVIYDKSLDNEVDMVTGANKENYHIKGVDIRRDLNIEKFEDVSKVLNNSICPKCKKGRLALKNGIEVGNIFQLGEKYTKAMDMTVLNENGVPTTPIMGCYGIGVGRAFASVIEESNDEKGVIFPMSIAPWKVHICSLRLDDEGVKTVSEGIYSELISAGIETLFDDRDVSAGIKFNDSELMGMPIRVVVSPRSIKNGEAEIKTRDGKISENVKLVVLTKRIKEIIEDRMKELGF